MVKIKISYRYFLFGIIAGSLIVFIVWKYLPDNKVHITFCNVGQGDAIYIRMPNQSDVLVDGGPDNKVLRCLSQHMPFYDRSIDFVFLTHPQKDHYGGLIEVFKRYTVGYFMTVPVGNDSESFNQIIEQLEQKKVPLKYLTSGNKINFDTLSIKYIWPNKEWLERVLSIDLEAINEEKSENLIAQLKNHTDLDLNIYSIYLLISYRKFSLLLTGDGDKQTQGLIAKYGINKLLPEKITILKVPHHGSKTALDRQFVSSLSPKFSVIQVGKKNFYGHPAQNTLDILSSLGKVLRTDLNGEITITSDGNTLELP